MQKFKRNQVEEAISALVDPSARAPSALLRTKLKRLLDADRDFDKRRRSTPAQRGKYAFFSHKRRGSGVEVQFSEYEAFALYMALCFLESGWPQTTAVSILRQARPQLERKHAEIVGWDAAALFSKEKLRELQQPGALAAGSTKTVYLAIITRLRRPIERRVDPTRTIEIIDGDELISRLRREAGLSSSNFELVTPMHRLRDALMKTAPAKRGRG